MKYEISIATKVEGKQRPRLGKHSIYSPSVDAERSLAWQIKKEWNEKYDLTQIACDIKLQITYLDNYYNIKRKKRKKEIIVTRKRRYDVDNYEKFVLDSIQKSGIIKNDVQACHVDHVLRHSETMQGLIIAILPAGFRCVDCGETLTYTTLSEAYCFFCKISYKF